MERSTDRDNVLTLGIDPGKSMAVSLLHGSTLIYAKKKVLCKDPVQRYFEMFKVIEDVVFMVSDNKAVDNILHISMACIEEPPLVRFKTPDGRWVPNVTTYGVLNRYVGAAAAALRYHEVPTQIVHNKTCKKFITGKGNATKDEVRAACARAAADDSVLEMPHDISDALSFSFYAQNELEFDWRVDE